MRPIISVAPMMDLTDRHARYLLRLIAPDIRLYTEMITARALVNGDKQHLLAYHSSEHPLALQLGGSEPRLLSQCAQMGEEAGYDEINLNVGCPSSRVSEAKFGACLMLEPTLVADCVEAMQQSVKIPVTIKCRIGVDQQDSYASLQQFVFTVSQAGCHTFIIHARKAWLKGLSPKENREIPPLQYHVVQQIKNDFPHLTIILNGGIKTITDAESALQLGVDGIMIGRAAYHNPYLLAEIQNKFYTASTKPSQQQIIQNFLPYVREQLKNKVRLASMTRHMLGLFQGIPGARLWRRYLSEQASRQDAGVEIIEEALVLLTERDNYV